MLKRQILVVAFLAFLFTGATQSAVASDAHDQLKVSMDKLIAVLKDEGLKAPEKKQERRAKIFAVLEERFDFEQMGKWSLGANWNTLSDEERKEFVATFSRLMENSYILKIERYTNEEIVFKDERIKGKYYYIYTDIISRDKAIPVNYSLHQKGDQWMAYDVVIEGVSLIKNYRTQFDETMRKEKFSGLMSRLKEQLSDLEKEVQKPQDA